MRDHRDLNIEKVTFSFFIEEPSTVITQPNIIYLTYDIPKSPSTNPSISPSSIRNYLNTQAVEFTLLLSTPIYSSTNGQKAGKLRPNLISS